VLTAVLLQIQLAGLVGLLPDVVRVIGFFETSEATPSRTPFLQTSTPPLLSQIHPTSYEFLTLSAMSATARQRTPSWATLIKSLCSNPSSKWATWILLFHLRLDLRSCHFPHGFQTGTVYQYAVLGSMRATWPTHPI